MASPDYAYTLLAMAKLNPDESRGKARLALTFLKRQLDSAASGAAVNGVRKTTFADSVDPPQRRTPEVRIYYPSRIASPLDIQETVNGVRSMSDSCDVGAPLT